MPAGGLVVKRRLADAALMEMRLNERKQQIGGSWARLDKEIYIKEV